MPQQKEGLNADIRGSEGMHTDGALAPDVGQCRFSRHGASSASLLISLYLRSTFLFAEATANPTLRHQMLAAFLLAINQPRCVGILAELRTPHGSVVMT
jgi:hypothetical protein